jgi:glycosyltransferase involved in cell wall biosynthesis
MPRRQWRVISFKLDEFFASDEALNPDLNGQVDYCLSFPFPSLPSVPDAELIWFQHAFGMWSEVNDHFISLLKETKRGGKKVVASFHTIHFQSEKTASGMQKKEEELLREALPLVDLMTVFTNGAYRAVIEAFPKYAKKVFVLRHGVHLYPEINQKEARKQLFAYLMNQADLSLFQKRELGRLENDLHAKETVLLGNYGFITEDKDPFKLFELGKRVQENLPKHRVVTLFSGKIQKRKDKTPDDYRHILEALKSLHNGKDSLFFEAYTPEEISPMAFRALDFAAFWCHNATQSGRMAHAQGTGVCALGRDWEGIGETLQLSGLPATKTLEELAEKIAELVLEPGLREEMAARNWKYAKQYCFANQAKKHLLLAQAVKDGINLSTLDEEEVNSFYQRENSYWKYKGFKEYLPRNNPSLH